MMGPYALLIIPAAGILVLAWSFMDRQAWREMRKSIRRYRRIKRYIKMTRHYLCWNYIYDVEEELYGHGLHHIGRKDCCTHGLVYGGMFDRHPVWEPLKTIHGDTWLGFFRLPEYKPKKEISK